MSITISGRKMPITAALRDYAEEKIGTATKIMEVSPLDIEVVLYVEKNPSNPKPATCEVTLHPKGHIIRVEEQEEDMYAAIDVASAKVQRQLRKYKTRVIDRKNRISGARAGVAMTAEASEGELDVDRLMEDLQVDDSVVRVKTVEFAPLTEEEALVQCDLLGHSFFAYTDRDTNLVHVMYKRSNGGYGILTQK